MTQDVNSKPARNFTVRSVCEWQYGELGVSGWYSLETKLLLLFGIWRPPVGSYPNKSKKFYKNCIFRYKIIPFKRRSLSPIRPISLNRAANLDSSKAPILNDPLLNMTCRFR
ncbi:hypothetical protein NQ317_005811 [Molorchus minor]|uniref:Uncharacterized protein n=1 Tax=Molorchus minor TaxID=1323400 RepID=A0ABQ9JE55_9CUCU|nr:hypothetical protein NQ317_005811 [Molorchus minor]